MTGPILRLKQAYRSGSGGWWVHVAYDEDGVEALKAAVPAPQRRWDKENERWWINDLAVPFALRVIPSLEAYLKQGALL